MTISSATGSVGSPRDHVLQGLSAAITAGTVKSADKEALTKAIGNIDDTLRTQGPPAGGSPRDIQAKLNSLVDDQVKSGALTDDQAKELKQVFSSLAPASGAKGGPDDVQGSIDTAASAASDALRNFLDTLKDSQKQQAGYDQQGKVAVSANLPSLLVSLYA